MPAVRFYIPSDLTPSVSPARGAGWEHPTTPLRIEAVRTKRSSVFTTRTWAGAVGVDRDTQLLQIVTEPLPAQTISGTVKMIFRVMETVATHDLQSQTLITAVSNDGTIVRGTLLPMDTSALSNEWATSLTNRKFPKAWSGSGATLTPLAIQNNDRLVIEVGLRQKQNTLSGEGTLEYGDASGSDLAENETGTSQFSPFIEFSDLVVSQPVTSVLKLHGGHINDGITRPDAILGQYDSLMVQWPNLQNDPSLVSRLKSINPNLKVVLYWFPQIHVGSGAGWVPPAVQTEIANHMEWFLHTPDGDTASSTRILSSDGVTRFMDMRVQAYRDFIINEIISNWIVPYGLDGYFNDGAGYVSGLHGLGWSPGLAATSAQIALFRGDNAQAPPNGPTPNVTFFQEMKTALGPSRRLIGAHWHTWELAANYADMIQFFNVSGRADGHQIEGAWTMISNPPTTFAPEASIDHHLDKFTQTLALGKYSTAAGRTSGSAAQIDVVFRKCFAFYLMQADGLLHHTGFWASPFYWTQAQIDFMKAIANALGPPLEPYFVESGSTSVLRRNFDGGYVRINKHATQTQNGLGPNVPEFFTPAGSAHGGILSSAGALTRQPVRSLSGALTPAGTLLNRPARSYAGGMTPSGVLTAVPSVDTVAISGAMTPAGALTKLVDKASLAAGDITPSAMIVKRADRTLTGGVTPAGSLVPTAVLLRSYAGAIMPAGVVVTQAFVAPGPALSSTMHLYLSGAGIPAYPNAPHVTRIAHEDRSWGDHDVEFDAIYKQAWKIASNLRPRLFRLMYEQRTGDELDALLAYFQLVGGTEGIFTFTHPTTGEVLRTRFAQDIITWEHTPKADLYTFEVALEEVVI